MHSRGTTVVEGAQLAYAFLANILSTSLAAGKGVAHASRESRPTASSSSACHRARLRAAQNRPMRINMLAARSEPLQLGGTWLPIVTSSPSSSVYVTCRGER
jgi:hypothetical protein